MSPELTISQGAQGLKVQNLRKSYRKRPVIRDVSLELTRGEVVALLGPNGSGKTTCFYSIAGLVMPDGGQVTIDGKNVTSFPMYRRARMGIGYLPQEPELNEAADVRGNVEEALADITAAIAELDQVYDDDPHPPALHGR